MQNYHYYILFLIIICFVIDIKIGLITSTIFFSIFSFFIIKNMLKSKTLSNEQYTYINPCNDSQPFNFTPKQQLPSYSTIQKCQPGSLSYNCAKFNSDPFKTKPVIVNNSMISINNAMQGGPNPKTLIPPMIVTPMYSLAQRQNDMLVPNKINTKTNEDLYLSGYLSSQHETGNGPDINENNDIIEDFTYPPADYTSQGWTDQVDTADGYNPKQWIDAKFPANLPQGNCGQQAVFADYNTNLFTNTVQPGVTYRDDVIEPINSNIGISFQQQFLPRTYTRSDNGDLEVVDHDPQFAPPREKKMNKESFEPTEYNSYDPRFTGYGTSYRNYVDEVTGQPRFPYDDINAVRMPNYIVRSKIDTHDFADRYGTVQTPQSLNDIRGKVENAFMQDTTEHRNDIMTSLMRKRNAEMWQIRQAPKYTSSGRRMGGF